MVNENENWQHVGETNNMDVEDILRFDHGDKTYCIYKLEDGFYATDGVCTHEAVHLEDGIVMDGEIECPMHQECHEFCSMKTPLFCMACWSIM